MHELSVVQHVISSLEKIGDEQKLTKIGSVTLEIGEVSCVLPDYLINCWNYMCKKCALTETAVLKIERIEAVTFCEDCKKTYPTLQYKKRCPHCGSYETYLVRGNEFNIKEIEAY